MMINLIERKSRLEDEIAKLAVSGRSLAQLVQKTAQELTVKKAQLDLVNELLESTPEKGE